MIHVAGTNAKGSTIAYLRAMLEAAGKSVHVYTSPHLVRFNERIRLAGKLVATRQRQRRRCEEVERDQCRQPITQFEITTVGGAETVCRDAGRLSAARSRAGRRLRFDQRHRSPAGHHHHAGRFRPSEMARQHHRARSPSHKAGILKRGAPAVIGRQRDEGLTRDRARRGQAQRHALRPGPRL